MPGQNTFIEITRSLRLYVPQLPITLAQQFIRDRYRRILAARDWSGCRREAQFLLKAAKSDGSVTFARGDTTIVGVGTAFDAEDVGRQFKVGTGSPVYTIIDVDVMAQELTINMPIGVNDSVEASYMIMDAFVTPPADFLRFVVVSNPQMGWRLRTNITSGELSLMDPQRTFVGQPYCLADRMYNVATAADAQSYRPQYEAWPYATSNQTLYYLYMIQGADLINDNDVPIWPIRSDAIVDGALADVARWPGTMEQPNPYFARPEYWKSYESIYQDKMIEIERIDEDVFMNYLDMNPMYGLPLFPITWSAAWLQSHAM